MDLSLIAAAVGGIDWAWWGSLAQGILALGVVIFIHEFGHFAAAKLCGVKVEKFYIGFDLFGLRLFRFRWGETEYGIGALPLGGYVYMLGQTDNPARQAEEAERAKLDAAEGKPVDPEAAAVWDPRSYPAQTVPERMFIISAGVIMNTITAFLFGLWAYGLGVESTPAAISAVSPGGPAWEHNLQSGDKFVEIDQIKDPRFEADLMSRVILADLERGLPMTIRRGDEEFSLTITPRKYRSDRTPALGVSMPHSTKLDVPRSERQPTVEWSPARRATPAFAPGDQVLEIDGKKIEDYTDIQEALVVGADRTLPFVVLRETRDDAGNVTGSERLTIEVAPNPWRTLGMSMEHGPVVSLQQDSPATKAGMQLGDRITSIDGEPLGDVLTLAERLRRKQVAEPDATWRVTVERSTAGGPPTPVTLDVRPRTANRVEAPIPDGMPISLPTIGAAFHVLPKVAAVEPGGPAAKAGVKPGDVFTQFKTVPTEEPSADTGKAPSSITVELTDEGERSWPSLVGYVLQENLRPSTKIELTTADGRTLVVEPVDEPGFFQADRGLLFDIPKRLRKAETFGQALDYAWYDTRDSLTQVYRFLHAIWIGQVPPSNVGGVITIAASASESASRGFPQLLLFILMLSCNLAVLNFLPVPFLDGGHMVFLIYEGIFRRPPPQRLYNILQLVGFALLISLMLFALKNDIVRLMR